MGVGPQGVIDRIIYDGQKWFLVDYKTVALVKSEGGQAELSY